jgi:hypothetical protein
VPLRRYWAGWRWVNDRFGGDEKDKVMARMIKGHGG